MLYTFMIIPEIIRIAKKLKKEETWKSAPGYPFYEVSTTGLVRRKFDAPARGTTPGMILKSKPNKKGYHLVTLRKDDETHSVYVHDLVGQAFVKDYKPSHSVNHIDHNKNNNAIENLEFITYEANSGEGRLTSAIIKKIKSLYNKGKTVKDISKDLGLKPDTIRVVIREV